MTQSMHKMVALTFVFFLLQSLSLSGQSKNIAEVRAASIEAFQNNNVELLIGLLSNPVEISLPNEENTFSKVQASEVLRKFMKANRIKSFVVKQSGKASGGNEFTIGTLTTEKGTIYQVYLFYSIISGKPYLSLIEFEQQ